MKEMDMNVNVSHAVISLGSISVIMSHVVKIERRRYCIFVKIKHVLMEILNFTAWNIDTRVVVVGKTSNIIKRFFQLFVSKNV